MNVKKYITNVLPNTNRNDMKMFLNVCENYITDQFTEEELDVIGGLALEMLKSNPQTVLVEFTRNRYPVVFQDIFNSIINLDTGFEFIDNFRISNGTPFDELVYFATKDTGCCGYYDGELEVDGVGYKVGFNYGH